MRKFLPEDRQSYSEYELAKYNLDGQAPIAAASGGLSFSANSIDQMRVQG